MSTAYTPREKKAILANLKASHAGLTQRINTLHDKGYIDDKIKSKLLTEHGQPSTTISLSMVNEDLTVKPSPVAAQVEAFEMLMNSGKAGSFAKVKSAPKDVKAFNPNKPISTMQLSTGEEEAVEPPNSSDGPNLQAQREAGADLASCVGAPKKQTA